MDDFLSVDWLNGKKSIDWSDHKNIGQTGKWKKFDF